MKQARYLLAALLALVLTGCPVTDFLTSPVGVTGLILGGGWGAREIARRNDDSCPEEVTTGWNQGLNRFVFWFVEPNEPPWQLWTQSSGGSWIERGTVNPNKAYGPFEPGTHGFFMVFRLDNGEECSTSATPPLTFTVL